MQVVTAQEEITERLRNDSLIKNLSGFQKGLIRGAQNYNKHMWYTSVRIHTKGSV